MIKFGPAGIPITCEEQTNLGGIKCCHKLGLEAMELEFVKGVSLNERVAKEIKQTSEELNISLSAHAPYYINLCSKDEEKAKTSKRNIYLAAKATFNCGGNIVVFHPGYYQKLRKEEAYEIAKKRLIEIKELLNSEGIKVKLGAETVGKKSAFGNLEENLKLANDVGINVVVDFAHLHARGDYTIKSENDYRKILEIVEREHEDSLKPLHVHFSEIEYNEKGEIKHLPLYTNNEPPFKELIKVLYESGIETTIICESPKLELDALEMKKEYNKIKKKN